LAINNRKEQDISEPWSKKSAVGLMKTRAEKISLGPNVENQKS